MNCACGSLFLPRVTAWFQRTTRRRVPDGHGQSFGSRPWQKGSGIGATIRIGRESWCLPYAWFFIYSFHRANFNNPLNFFWRLLYNWVFTTEYSPSSQTIICTVGSISAVRAKSDSDRTQIVLNKASLRCLFKKFNCLRKNIFELTELFFTIFTIYLKQNMICANA